MKDIISFVTFILIVGFLGSWEIGVLDFKAFLLCVMITLSIVLAIYTVRFAFMLSRAIKKAKKPVKIC